MDQSANTSLIIIGKHLQVVQRKVGELLGEGFNLDQIITKPRSSLLSTLYIKHAKRHKYWDSIRSKQATPVQYLVIGFPGALCRRINKPAILFCLCASALYTEFRFTLLFLCVCVCVCVRDVSIFTIHV